MYTIPYISRLQQNNNYVKKYFKKRTFLDICYYNGCMTEKEKMLLGKIYDPVDPELCKERIEANKLCLLFNSLAEDDPKKPEIFKKLFPNADETVFVRGPVFVDYGSNIKIGKHCYFNFNLTALDVCPITIGDNCFFGPNVSLLTAMHPYVAKEREIYFNEKDGRTTDREFGKPITIGNNCWICGNVTILPGVTIHDNVVVGAGSVVVKDLPSGAIYVGNPATKLRDIDPEKESIYNRKELW